MSEEKMLAQKIHEIMNTELHSVNGRRKLRKIIVRCDDTDMLDIEKLNESWRQVATESIYDASHIELHHDPLFGKCLVCNEEFELDDDTSRCPRCHCEQFKIIHEPPTIETYEIDAA